MVGGRAWPPGRVARTAVGRPYVGRRVILLVDGRYRIASGVDRSRGRPEAGAGCSIQGFSKVGGLTLTSACGTCLSPERHINGTPSLLSPAQNWDVTSFGGHRRELQARTWWLEEDGLTRYSMGSVDSTQRGPSPQSTRNPSLAPSSSGGCKLVRRTRTCRPCSSAIGPITEWVPGVKAHARTWVCMALAGIDQSMVA